MTDTNLGVYVPRLLLQRDANGPAHWEAEGTLVVADISGFTRLTEKLSRRGKAGAEEIVRTVSDVFTVLLTATADGGDVLKFSGDALLLFYDSTDHAQRACHAALTLQRVLRLVGGIDSSRGRVRLRMSIGVHSGRFSLLVCGGDHLELFVLGAAASTAVATERAARAGEVLVSSTTAAALSGATFGSARGDAVVVRSVPPLPPVALVEPPDPTVGTRARPFVAPPLRDRLGTDDMEHEHRRATVAFAHFGGVDDLLAREGPDATFARVQALTTATMTALERFGVLLTATDVVDGGGALMLTAGAPDATGDDEARMLRVAREVVDADCGLPVRIGVNAGDLFVGAVGPPFRRTYATMGAATNLAARVTAAAEWNTVLATGAVIDSIRGRFAITPVPAFTVKGHDHAVDAGVVDAAISAVAASADRSVPFTGRGVELGRLCTAAADVRAGRGAVVEIVGAAGLGKSRLVTELRARSADAMPWITTACDPYERTSPYRTAEQVMRQLLGIDGSAAPAAAGAELAELVGAVAPELLEWLPLIAVTVRADVPQTARAAQVAPQFRRIRTQQAVGDLLTEMPAAPTVIVLEDAQHMDEASAELLATLLARLLPAHPWLVVVTRTPGATGLHAGRGHEATVVTLEPLDPDTCAALAARLAEHTPLPSHDLPRLVERAAGNPQFLAALVDGYRTGSHELPRSVEAIIATRIDQLAPADRRTLRYLSVLGERFDAELLDRSFGAVGVTSDQPDRWRRLAEFVAVDDRAIRFRNALVREVAYEGLAYRRRRQLHGLVADALDSSPDQVASQLPVHLVRAERWDDAWVAARDAAVRARDSGANAVAGELYEMALRAARQLGSSGADVGAVAIEAGEAWELVGMWERALAAYDVAAAATRSPVDRLPIALRRARAHEGAGRYSHALRLYRRVLTTAGTTPVAAGRDRCRARAHAGYASARLGQGRPADAIASARDAVECARAAGDDETLAQAYHLLDRAHAALGDHVASAGYRDLALPAFAALGDLASQGTVLHDLGADAQQAGRLEEALWLYERSHDARSRAGDVVRAAATDHAIGEVLVALGRLEQARTRCTAALRVWRGARAPRGVADATFTLGVIALRSHDHAEAVRLLDEAAQGADRIGAAGLRDAAQLPLAQALLACGRYVEAWEAATRVLHHTDRAGEAHRVRAVALVHTGGIARARLELTAALDAATDAHEAGVVARLLDEIDAQPG